MPVRDPLEQKVIKIMTNYWLEHEKLLLTSAEIAQQIRLRYCERCTTRQVSECLKRLEKKYKVIKLKTSIKTIYEPTHLAFE